MISLLSLFVSVVVLAVIAYVTYVLFPGESSGSGSNIGDYIVDSNDDAILQEVCSDDKYHTVYGEPGKQLLILYGTEYGFSEEVAHRVFDKFADDETCLELSLQPRVINAKDFSLVNFSHEQVLLCVISTTGDGVPPTDTRSFMEFIDSSESAASFSCFRYSVLALGDSSYPHYCRTGKHLDIRLHELGGQCLHERVDVDQEDWPCIEHWLDAVFNKVIQLNLNTALDYLDLSNSIQTESDGFNRTRPFLAEMIVKYPLTVIGSSADKETIHAEFDLTGSGLVYTSGDALGIYPLNNPCEVDAALSALRCSGDEEIPVPAFSYFPKPKEPTLPLREGLMRYYDLKTVKFDLVRVLIEHVTEKEEKEKGHTLLKDGISKKNQKLAEFVAEREVVDVLQEFSSFSCSLHDIITCLRSLQPRYYSIASSPSKDTLHKVAVCAAVLRYSLLGRHRTGVCTTFLQDRLPVGGLCPVFISQNPDFRLPSNGDLPIVMIGPGTGIAPFRAFIQERILSNAKGLNVLYFGCRNKDKDFLYKDELQQLAAESKLILRTAFSRDQLSKVYVQDIMREDVQWLWQLIESGAHVYVCGDAKHMANDVHCTLLDIFCACGGMSRKEAEDYMDKLESLNRYQRDVWVT